MKTCGGGYRYNSNILELDTKRSCVVSFTPRPLYTRGKSPRCPSYRRLDRLQNWPERRGVEKIFLILPGLELRPSNENLHIPFIII
jgi:hypothetical protein